MRILTLSVGLIVAMSARAVVAESEPPVAKSARSDNAARPDDQPLQKLPSPPEPADLVFRGGAVYTVDAVRSWAEAVAVRNGRIVHVGPDSGVRQHVGPQTRVIDLRGKMLLPGFHDSHVHLIGGGIEMAECDINGLTTLKQIQDTVRRYAEKHPDKKWIRGGGWPLTLEGGNPRSRSRPRRGVIRSWGRAPGTTP